MILTMRTFQAAFVAVTVFLALPAAAQLPRVDQAFAGAGQLFLPWTRSNLDRDALAPGPSNGEIFMATEEEGSLRLLKLDSNGVPVSSYVGGGIARLQLSQPLDLGSIAPQPDGSVLLGGRRDVMRADPLGRIDLAFGDQGRIRIPFLSNSDCTSARVRNILAQGGGFLVVATNFYIDTSNPSVPIERACTFVARLKADGTPDLAFGTNGNLVRPDLRAFDVAMKDGYIEILGRYAQQSVARIERVDFSGKMVESYGAFGSLQLPDTGAPSRISDGRILADGSVVFIGSRDSANVTIYRLKADRTVDLTFTGTGRSVIPIRNQDPATFDRQDPRVLPVVDGGFIVRTRVTETSPSVVVNEDLYKLDSRGLPDARFGDNGYARHRVRGDSRIVAWMIQPDGYVVYSAAPYSGAPVAATSLPGNPSPLPYYSATPYLTRIQAVPDIVEFYNTFTKHYFLAFDGPEAAGIDGGAAGPGWGRTGQGFRFGGLVAVCRFYNGAGNTHFFTIDPAECENVKHLPNYFYEGLGFYLTRPDKGVCPAPLIPIRRLFNNRADPNHRYIVDISLAPAMVAQGWTLEGVAFCAKP